MVIDETQIPESDVFTLIKTTQSMMAINITVDD